MAKIFKILMVMVVVALLTTSCALFNRTPTQQPGEVTPNLTLTALFDTSHNIPATITPPAVFTATSPAVLPTVAPTITDTATSVPPTATTAPSATAVPPTATAVVMQREGKLMTAAYLSTPPSLDGSWSEWKEKTVQYPVKSVVWGAKNWTGDADLEGSYIAGWDEDNLYLGVKVYDDVYAQGATGANLYKGDSLEVLIDTNLYGDFFVQSLDSDDYQLGISGGNADKGIEPEAYLWFPSKVAGSRSQVDIAYSFDDGLYRAEVQIPWSMLGIKPSKGMVLGFAVSISDNDDKTQNVQQTMLSSAAHRSLVDPTTWGWITLK